MVRLLQAFDPDAIIATPVFQSHNGAIAAQFATIVT